LRSFDIAVQSRIRKLRSPLANWAQLTQNDLSDIALEYRDLSEAQRENIFLEFVNQLSRRNLVANLKEVKDWIDEDGKSKDFNGRQIRNVVWTAMSIANSQSRGLERKDLTLVSKHVTQFQKALQAQDTIYRATQINPK
jgi:hypothetical protein